MTKQDIIQLIQDRAIGGGISNDNLFKVNEVTIAAMINTVLTEAMQSGRNMLGNAAFGFSYTALSGDYYINLSPKPLSGAWGVKYVADDCGNKYFGRRNMDQDVAMSFIRQLALPEYYVNDDVLTFGFSPNGTSYTVYMFPDFVVLEDDVEFTCPNLDALVFSVVEKLKQTNQGPKEEINNTKTDQ